MVLDLGLGDSGLFNADSSQLDFVGLHLLESMLLDGLTGGVGLLTSSSCGAGAGLISILSDSAGFSEGKASSPCCPPSSSGGWLGERSIEVPRIILAGLDLEPPVR